MVPFDVMTGRNCMVCNSRGVADLCKSFEMLGPPVMQSSFCFADVEGITVPTTGFIRDGRHVGFAIIMQISHTLLRGQTTQVREVITNILATQMICFTLIECLSPK